MKQAIPNLKVQKENVNIPIEVKKHIAEKIKASAKWHQSYFLEDKTKYNQLNNKLELILKQMRDNRIYYESQSLQ